MDDTTLEREQARLLRQALHRAGIELNGLWLQYFRLGGDLGETEIDAYLHHCLHLPAYQRDLLAHAANNLIDQLTPPRAPYTTDLLGSHRTD